MSKFSLVVVTLGRQREVKTLFESFKNQDYKNFEVIVVDQNPNDIVETVVEEYSNTLDIKYFRVDFRGAGKAKDFGVKYCTGDIAAFPDDDCYYEKDVLLKVNQHFEQDKKLGIFSTGTYDTENSNNFSSPKNFIKPIKMTIFNFMGLEYSHFFNLNVIDKKDFFFDHNFGAGCKYKAAEGIELLIRLFSKGYKGSYEPKIKIYHPKTDLDPKKIKPKYYSEGAFIKKALNNKNPYILYYIARKMIIAPCVKMIVDLFSLNKDQFLKDYENYSGVWEGFLSYND